MVSPPDKYLEFTLYIVGKGSLIKEDYKKTRLTARNSNNNFHFLTNMWLYALFFSFALVKLKRSYKLVAKFVEH
jgi:hypothetical protein